MMPRKKKTTKNELNKDKTTSLTFVWNKGVTYPKMTFSNLKNENAHDVILYLAETLMVTNKEYYPVLLMQLQKTYDYLYNRDNSTIN